MSSRLALLAGLFLSIPGCASLEHSMARGTKWLLPLQSANGGWRSKTYQALSGGAALTPLVLLALHGQPDLPREMISNALLFVQGSVGQTREYPTYTAALSIEVLTRYRPRGWEEDVRRLTEFLRSRQLTEERGWNPEDPEFGAWDHGTEVPVKPRSQRPDISVTAFAVAALRSAGVAADDPALRRAVLFSDRCRNADGGYYFTPQTSMEFQNKAGRSTDGTLRSYATATCDAVRILQAAGISDDDARRTDAEAWLRNNFDGDRPAGFPDDLLHRSDSLSFYYIYVLSVVRPSWAPTGTLLSSQRSDGAWANAVGLMKEDDPIIATSLAMLALHRVQRGLSK